MTKKVQIMVKIFETSDQDDYIVPSEMSIAEVIALIVKIAFPENHPAHKRLDRFVLMDADRQAVCGGDKTAEQCGLARGSKLLLI
ncbi:MAG: hypothetical protein LBS84_09040 [Clostridiales bacterium]|jgi:hypothetical protein|nr:hypothetical protein [Clostridiales bacterium]